MHMPHLNDKGLTFVELLFSSIILVMVMLVTVSIFNMTGRMTQNSHIESELYAEGMYVMDMIQRGESGLYGIMKARSSTLAVAVDGKSVTFLVDKNSNYSTSTADDINMSIAFDNGDGNNATLDDNSVVIDPNTTVAGDGIEVGRYLEDLTFSEAGGVVTVDLVMTRSTRAGPRTLEFSREILMRN